MTKSMPFLLESLENSRHTPQVYSFTVDSKSGTRRYNAAVALEKAGVVKLIAKGASTMVRGSMGYRTVRWTDVTITRA
jgi:hypothetical protein